MASPRRAISVRGRRREGLPPPAISSATAYPFSPVSKPKLSPVFPVGDKGNRDATGSSPAPVVHRLPGEIAVGGTAASADGLPDGIAKTRSGWALAADSAARR